jgi:solute:Na+ symporter, SSS family
MSPIDYAVITLYFVVVIGLGFWYRKRAAQDLDAYFLGGKRMPWLALAMSGSVSNFDITGTMWIVSMLFLMGLRSMWIHWMWGWMMGAFFLAYMGKWVRRSKVMTGAEWMLTRFGSGPAGTAARMAAALMAVVTMAGMIGYAFQGIGKFAFVYLPFGSPHILATGIIAITTLYVLLGGLYSVVVTDVVQTVIVTLASIVIAVVAYNALSPEALAEALPSDWVSLMPVWRIKAFAGTENANYELFGVLIIVWVIKGFLLNAGGPGGMYEFQRFLAARDARDAAKIGAAWSVFMIVRWAMVMGIALLGLVAFRETQNPEVVVPRVLNEYMDPGIKGFVLAGLLAAFMSTFSSTVNSGASYLIRDFWQPHFRPNADEHSLV